MLTMQRAWVVLALALAGEIDAQTIQRRLDVRPRLHQKDHVHGAVASESSVCSQIGSNLLQLGGNAADAMVGTVLCVGVIGMYHSGIGGGGFMLVRNSNGTYENIDFRETAPAAAFQDMYNSNVDLSLYGGLASGVPGELRGLEYLHKNYGKLDWQHVVWPAIGVARDGFLVTADLVKQMNSVITGSDNFLVDDPGFAIDFAPNGTLIGLGEVITRKRYAETLETIAKEGVDAFYHGALAHATIQAVQSANGTMTRADLAKYSVVTRRPASIAYRDYKLTSCSAPASGTVALAIMRSLEEYADIGAATAINISTHRLDEAIRFAYGQRSKLGDPSFLPDLEAYQAEMLNQTTSDYTHSHILDNSTQPVSAYNPSNLESLELGGTSHVVTADKDGMAISLTTTINLIFGSRLVVPETGVIMNNEMNDFSIPNQSNAFGYVPSPANFIRPGKRPLSSISPTIVEHGGNGSLYYVIGSAGGSKIITATVQNLWHVLDQNMTASQALAEPRLHDQLAPNGVTFEYPYNNATTAFMASLGHNISFVAPGLSTAQAIRILPGGQFEAAGEPRQTASGGIAV